jgi:hypothetical protein
MANNRDAILLETVRTHRDRLLAAFLFGELGERRTANDNVKRLIGGIVLGAVACAACVGVSFVSNLLAEQAAAQAKLQQQQEQLLSPSPTPSPSPTHSRKP